MIQMAELTTQVLARGRQTKFTPERIQQIKNLVERGKEPRGDRRVDRGDPWFPASHLLKVGGQLAATYF